jgi:hypothetical protein
MEIIKIPIDLQKETKLRVFFLADVHEGSANFNKPAFDKTVKFILEESKKVKTIVFTVGDMVDLITHSDKKRFNPSEIDGDYKIRDLKNLSNLQIDRVCEKLSPIKHLIKGAVIGNHEESYIKYHSNDVYTRFVENIGCQKIGYVGFTILQLSNTNIGDIVYSIGFNHGYGTCSDTPGSAVKQCMKFFAPWKDLDLGVMAHYHLMGKYTQYFKSFNRFFSAVTKVTRHYITCGSFLDQEKIGSRGYAEHYPRGSTIGVIYTDLTLVRKSTGSQHERKRSTIIETEIKELIF